MPSTAGSAVLLLLLSLAGWSSAIAQGPSHSTMAVDEGATMVAKAAGLVETLKGSGPFTVFAPTNAAFAALPEGTVPTLLEPGNKERLTGVLTYHVVPGRYDAAALMKAIRQGGGKASLRTASGHTLWLVMNGERNVVVRDAQGGVANIAVYDVIQSNGVIHVVDRVLLPS